MHASTTVDWVATISLLATITLSACASPPDDARSVQVGTPTSIRSEAGVLEGDAAAPIQILEFADFECEYCRRQHKTLHEIMRRHSTRVAIRHIHFPASRVGMAYPAAIAAQCAAEQGKYASFARLVYASQDSLGKLSFGRLAVSAGIPDSLAFEECRLSDRSRRQVVEDVKEGRKLGVSATPTLFINGNVHVGELPLDSLELRLQSITAALLIRP